MSQEWKVQVGDELVDVCGFRRPQRAREHVRKHFLEKGERWELVAVDPGPGKFRKLLAEAEELAGRKHSPEVYAVLDNATTCYQHSVEKNTVADQTIRSVMYTHTPDSGGKPYPALGVISRLGIFSAFFRSAVSDLRTSFRLKPGRTHRGPIRPRDYLNNAHKYLDRKLAQSELTGD